MSRSTARALVLTALLASLTPGCAVVRQLSFAEPSVDLAAVQLVNLGLDGGTLDVELAVHNPNPYRIQGKEFTGELTLEETRFGSLARPDPWLLPATADTTVTLRVAFTWSAVGSAARALLERGTVRYRLTGRMLVGTTADERWLSISRSGEVPLERLRP